MRCGADSNASDITAARLTRVLFSSCSSVSGKGSRDDQWDAFVSEFPVTMGALAPSKEDLVGAVFGDERTPYFKWRRIQLEKRVLHVSGRQRLCLCQTLRRSRAYLLIIFLVTEPRKMYFFNQCICATLIAI